MQDKAACLSFLLSVVNDDTTLLKILMAENAIRIINAVSKAVKGFFRLQNARKKNRPENNNAINTIIYFGCFLQK